MRFTILLLTATQAIRKDYMDDMMTGMPEPNHGPGGPGNGEFGPGEPEFPGATLYIDEVDGKPANITLHVDQFEEHEFSDSDSGNTSSDGGPGAWCEHITR